MSVQGYTMTEFTVGSLRAILGRLPDEMPVRIKWDGVWCAPHYIDVVTGGDAWRVAEDRKDVPPTLVLNASAWGFVPEPGYPIKVDLTPKADD